MNSSRVLFCVVVLMPFVTGGCSKRANIWASRQDHREIAVENAAKLTSVTHNGAQTAVGVADHGDLVVVEADVRAAGITLADAQAALDALVVSVERKGETIEVAWDWNGRKDPMWRGEVHFDIRLPATLAVKLTTHNGRVKARDVAGDCTLETHNGAITAVTTGRNLIATTHNGTMSVTTSAARVNLETHNGEIDARLTNPGDVGGTVVTYNGSITLVLGENTAAKLDCATSNGRIHCNHAIDKPAVKRASLTGVLRGGAAGLHVETHNGSVRIQ